MITGSVANMLLKVLNVENANKRKQEDLLAVLEAFCEQTLINCICANLNKEDLPNFLKLLKEEESGEKALVLARVKIPDLDNKLKKIIEEEIKNIT